MADFFSSDDDNEDDDLVSGFVNEAEEPEASQANDASAEELNPRSNPELFGHEHIEELLLREFQADRLPHAIILAGPRGIGKASLAYRLAKFLFSGAKADAKNFFTSPNHPAFKRVVSLGHSDLLLIEREFDEKKGAYKNEISVDNARRVHPFLQMTSSDNGWRVVIIDGADALNNSSQNAILKILEEAPKRSLLILTANQPGVFLPTIRSRCRILNMKPLNDALMNKLLNRFLPSAKDDDKKILISMAQGSIGVALEFYQNAGLELYKEISEILKNMPNLNLVKLHELAERLGKSASDVEYRMTMEIILKYCEHKAKACALGGSSETVYSGQHYLNAWDNISTIVQNMDRFNLDKRQGVIEAFLTIQNPEYKISVG